MIFCYLPSTCINFVKIERKEKEEKKAKVVKKNLGFWVKKYFLTQPRRHSPFSSTSGKEKLL